MQSYRSVVLSGVLALAACSSTEAPVPTEEPVVSREQAAAADDGVDYCGRYGWYDDGICDDFCVLPDPDCGQDIPVTCAGLQAESPQDERDACCAMGEYPYCEVSPLASQDGEGPSLCVGVRGNGERITSHFASLARIAEHYGLFDGIAGGSSGSITSFLVESVQMNPFVRCAGCTPYEQGRRAAVLFKSLHGYFGLLAASGEGQAIGTLTTLAGQIQEQGIEAMLTNDPTAGVEALIAILESDEVLPLINAEVLSLLSESPDPVFHARDIVGALQNAANFNAEDPSIFVRPGLVSFETFARRLGRIGSFFAAYEPVDRSAMENFLNECGDTRGLLWSEITELETSDGSTCGALFNSLAGNFRSALLENEDRYASRIDERVGQHLPALITTGVLQGDAADQWRAARASYLAGEDIDWSIDFADVRFGYFGQDSDLERVAGNVHGYTDLRTAQRVSLGALTWAQVLAMSPAEPGLSRGIELPGGDMISVGGWSDLQPVQALRNLGCEKVIYLTRRGGPSGFFMGITELLGASDADREALVDLAGPSAFRTALEDATGIWCTDWDTPPATDLEAMYEDGYNAPLQTSDRWLGAVDGYPIIGPNLGVMGCTAGVE